MSKMNVAARAMACVLAAAMLSPVTAYAAEPAQAQIVPAVVEGAAVTDVSAQILALQVAIPEGTPWTNEANVYTNTPTWPFRGRGCVAFAMQVSDLVYGADAPMTILYGQTPADLQAGDAVYVGGTHMVVVISVDADTITVCEGNYNSSVHWGRIITKASLEGQINFLCRRSR